MVPAGAQLIGRPLGRRGALADRAELVALFGRHRFGRSEGGERLREVQRGSLQAYLLMQK